MRRTLFTVAAVLLGVAIGGTLEHMAASTRLARAQSQSAQLALAQLAAQQHEQSDELETLFAPRAANDDPWQSREVPLQSRDMFGRPVRVTPADDPLEVERFAAREPLKPTQIGRYQGTVSGDILYLFDTATGECWNAKVGGSWIHAMPPVER